MENTKYTNVINFIVEQIDNRIYIEGQMIDSENVLSDRLGVSRVTVRKALDHLVNKGVLFKEKGRGTFVSNKPKYSDFTCGIAFSKEALNRGHTPSTKDAILERYEADDVISRKLKVPIKTVLWRISRTRCMDNNPVVYAIEYFIYSQIPDLTLDIVETSIYNHIEKKGVVANYFDQKLVAVNSDRLVSKKLDIAINTPLIEANIITYAKNGSPFSYSIEYYKTTEFSLLQTIYVDKLK